MSTSKPTHPLMNITVIVSALGYFVDMYDLLLFNIVRISSLKALGYSGAELTDYGVLLLNMQMAGMLIGGILWGTIGDRKGRLNILFGSIILYSIANISNAFATDIITYATARFFAGLGLAGELGAAITLVSETLPTKYRGYGTAIVASVGIFGSVLAAIVGDFFDWKTAYIIGGVLGLILLVLRFQMRESLLFSGLQSSTVKKGQFLRLFTSRTMFIRYVRCILIGLPTWFVVGVLITFSPEFGKVLGIAEPVSAGRAVMFTYIGLVAGDIGSGFGSQLIKSRKKMVFAFLIAGLLLSGVYLFLSNGISLMMFYTLCLLLGISIGYWAVFVTIGAEQFGTNMRATVATTVPNFVRGSTILITLSFKYLSGSLTIIHSALIVGSVVFAIAFLALKNMEETYDKDMNFLENI